MARFGKVVRDARTAARRSLQTVADELGFTVAYISDLERGNRMPPSEEVIRKWAEFIGRDPEELIFLAKLERQQVALAVDPQYGNAPKNEAAVALARSWDDLSDEEYQEILDLLRRRNEVRH